MPVMKEILKIVSNGFDIHVFRILRAITGMLKGPVALSIFNLEISFSISQCVSETCVSERSRLTTRPLSYGVKLLRNLSKAFK